MVNNYRWQVPGNGNPFDSPLYEWETNKMSTRSIAVLEFINVFGFVSKPFFEENFKDYIKDEYGHFPNDSLTSHFYRPLEFIGFIINNNDNLSLSHFGKYFLKEIHNNNYESALDYYIAQLFETKYPNTATKSIKLNLFPFRIIFNLLSNGPVNLDWFLTKIPYIKNRSDFENIELIDGKPYNKWKTWVIPYLKNFEILDVCDNFVILTDFKKECIKDHVAKYSINDMFF